MAIVVFDTLILSRKLAAAGMPTEQAQGVAAAIAETLGEQIATRRDLEDLGQDLRRDSQEVRRDLTARIDQVEAKLTARIDQVEAKLTARIDQVEAKLSGRIEQVEAKLTVRIEQVEAKLTGRIDLLESGFRAELRQSEQRQTIRLGLMLAGGLAVIATLVKLL